jgi:hypothetical protein
MAFLLSLHSTAEPAPRSPSHLRVLQDDRGRLRKIENWVSFPFLLKLGSYCEPADGEVAAGPSKPVHPCGLVYQLLGVVEHWGNSLRCGHSAVCSRRSYRSMAAARHMVAEVLSNCPLVDLSLQVSRDALHDAVCLVKSAHFAWCII